MTKTLLCLGYGYTAKALARRLQRNGASDAWRIVGATRDPANFEEIEADGAAPVLWPTAADDDKNGGGLDPSMFDGVDAVLVSAGPNASGCPVFAVAEEAISARAAEIGWIGYLSSNGVYGDHDGAWVDERSALKPTSARGKNRVRAEAQWAGLGVAFDLPTVVFRLPGIYGPGRSAIEAVCAGRARRIVKPGQVFSRAHVDDIAAALEASLNAPRAGSLFNVADDEPAPPQDVITHACALLGVAPPPLEPFDSAAMSDMQKSFYADNKRVKNDLMKSVLGVELAYPDYRVGLEAILKTSLNG